MQVVGEYSQVGREPSPAEVLGALEAAFVVCGDARSQGYILTALTKQALHITQHHELLHALRASLGGSPNKDIIQVRQMSHR